MDSGEALAKVLNSYGLLEGDGEFKIICPFHGDVNASMKINLHDGSFYCFGCQLTGDALKFVKLVNPKMDDLQACMEMYKIIKSSGAITFVAAKSQRQSNSKQSLIEAYDYYFGLKTMDWSEESGIEKDYMSGRGFSPATLTRCKAKLTYNSHYPIIFPMFDLGRFKGWVCRTMDKKIEEKRKYLYNAGFSRRDTIVGEYRNKVVVLVEGYMDWLKMKQLGVDHVSAILGWKLTEQQITKLKDAGVKTIISALDKDKCGEDGTKYAAKFFNVIRFQFPEKVKDPGDLSESGFILANRKTKSLYRRHLSNESIR